MMKNIQKAKSKFYRRLLSPCTPLVNPIEIALETLQNLILNTDPPKGEPFPQIPGPKKEDKVCIVGAGPAGIHMALKLKKLGHTDVTIYEKSGRVGGKSYDVNFRGAPYPLGTIFFEPNYFDNVVALAREYDVGEILPIPSTGMWLQNQGGTNISLAQYYVRELSKFTNSQDPLVNVAFMLTKIIKYIRLHNELFGGYEGDFMLRPSEDILHRTRGTLLEFLKREGLEPMHIAFKTSNELQGYGYIDEVSALYGLLWNKPKFMFAYALRLMQQPLVEPYMIGIFKEGYEVIWKIIVEKENIDVKFNQDIYSVKRKYDRILLKLWTGSSLETVLCDFIIWAAPMKEFLRTVSDATHQEWSLFKGLIPEIFTASLVNVKNAVKNSVYNAYLPNLNTGTAVEHGVTASVNMRGLQTPDIANPEVLEEFNKNTLETLTCLQLGKNKTDELDRHNKLRNHYEDGFGASSVEIIKSISWEYFYRWSPEEMQEGRLWEVFSVQGRSRTWYIGSSVSFEAIRSVMEYNNLLVSNMVPHDQFYQN